VIFLDGSPDGMEKTMKQIQAMMLKPAGTEINGFPMRDERNT